MLWSDIFTDEGLHRAMFDIDINESAKARVEIVNVRGDLNGVCAYRVIVTQPNGQTELYVQHDRRDGMWKLMELVCAKIHDLETKDD